MKKYVKPELFYESFELSQQIAACAYDSHNTSSEDCVFTGDDGLMIFRSGCGGKDAAGNDIFFVESFCYHNGSDSPYGIFNS